MRNHISTIIIALILMFVFKADGQELPDQIVVPLKLYTKDIPFKLSGACFTKLSEGTRSKFKGAPDFLNKTNSIIKTVAFGHGFPIKDSVYLLIGDKNDTERVCIIDCNNNHDFSDDFEYQFNKESLNRSSVFIPQSLHFKYSYKGKGLARVLYLRPDFYPGGLRFSDPLEQKYFVVLQLAECRIGHFKFNRVAYKVAAAMPTPRPLYDSATVFSIIKKGEKFPSSTNNINFYKRYQNIILDSQIFRITNIHPSGDTAFIKYTGKRTSKEIGYEENLYAPEITEFTVKENLFDLNSYKGKYVLIDFWGTWCGPCVRMIPELRTLHKKYKDLIMISIACENDNINTLMKAIDKYEMNWINIYEPFKGNHDILKSFRINSYPTTILIDRDGKIIFRGGSSRFKTLEKLLQNLYE